MPSDILRARMTTELERAASLSSDHTHQRGDKSYLVVSKTPDYYSALDRARLWRTAAETLESAFNDPAIIQYLSGRRSLE